MSNTPKGQTAQEIAEEIKDKYSHYIGDSISDFEMVNGRDVILPGDIIPMLTEAMETYAAQQNKALTDLYNHAVEVYTDKIEQLENLIHSNQPPTEDKRSGEIEKIRFLLEYLLEHDDGVGICLGYQSREMIEDTLKGLNTI